MNLDTKKFQDLVMAKDLPGIKSFLEDFAKQELTPAEEGEVYAVLIQVYMQVSTQINKVYDEDLSEILETLEPLLKMEREVGDTVDLANIRDQLS